MSMDTYPFLSEWLDATRRSESGLIAVLLVAAVAVGLLYMYNRHIADDMPQLRRIMMILFVLLSLGLVILG